MTAAARTRQHTADDVKWSGPMRIDVAGVQLTVHQTTTKLGTYVKIKRIVGRDRKRKIDITCGIETRLEKGDEAGQMLRELKRVAAMKTANCTCDYRYGYSGHAEHCFSIYKATDPGAYDDDD